MPLTFCLSGSWTDITDTGPASLRTSLQGKNKRRQPAAEGSLSWHAAMAISKDILIAFGLPSSSICHGVAMWCRYAGAWQFSAVVYAGGKVHFSSNIADEYT